MPGSVLSSVTLLLRLEIPRCAVTVFVVVDDNVTELKLESSVQPKETKDVVEGNKWFP